jgi:hypothetical protein
MVDLGFAPEAQEFGQVIAEAIEARGGFDVVMAAEDQPDTRADVADLLAGLGIWELEPAADEVQLQAAALACRAAGRFALPYPIAERLARPTDIDADAVTLIHQHPRINMGDLPLRWVAVDLTDTVSSITARPGSRQSRLGPFVVDGELGQPFRTVAGLSALLLNLTTYQLLGMLDATFQETVRHVREREQFGSLLVNFQGVQYQLSEAVVVRQTSEELASYALWSAATGRPASQLDAVAARAAVLEAADVVFRVAHQLHGATGFCDETAVSWLSRDSQALRRLPTNRSETSQVLAKLVGKIGFDGLFSPATTGESVPSQKVLEDARRPA